VGIILINIGKSWCGQSSCFAICLHRAAVRIHVQGTDINIPVISSTMITNAPQSGSIVLTMLGRSFGLEDMSNTIVFGATECEYSIWNSDSAFRCKVSSGQPSFNGILLQYSEGVQVHRSITLSAKFCAVLSYNIPVALPCVNTSTSNAPTTGSSVSIVSGRSLNYASSRAKIGFSSCEDSIWFSASELQCRFSAGSSSRHFIRVSVHSKSGSLSEAYTYNNPSISSQFKQILRPQDPILLPSSGSTSLSLPPLSPLESVRRIHFTLFG
jgi:hypothetical protein